MYAEQIHITLWVGEGERFPAGDVTVPYTVDTHISLSEGKRGWIRIARLCKRVCSIFSGHTDGTSAWICRFCASLNGEKGSWCSREHLRVAGQVQTYRLNINVHRRSVTGSPDGTKRKISPTRAGEVEERWLNINEFVIVEFVPVCVCMILVTMAATSALWLSSSTSSSLLLLLLLSLSGLSFPPFAASNSTVSGPPAYISMAQLVAGQASSCSREMQHMGIMEMLQCWIHTFFI